MKRLKRVVVKQELVEITGDIFKAIILNQFVYWSERVYDFDTFIAEERERMSEEGQTLNMQPTEGWIYKSAEELNDETMLGISAATMGRHIKALIDAGYLLQRNNPDHKWDRTKQYRVDFVKLCKDLSQLGYTLDGYAFFTETDTNFKMKNGVIDLKDRDANMKNQYVQNEKAIPEITTKTTSEITYNNKEPIAAVQKQIESHLGTSISTLLPLLGDWIQQYGEEVLVDTARFVGSKRDKWNNIVGTYRAAVTTSWSVNEIMVTDERDERYENFYQLFPKG